MEKGISSADKNQAGLIAANGTSSDPSGTPAVPPPLFRGIDWITLAITFAFVFAAYCLTLAPSVSLEDSGELAVGSFYAGIPHPPGYPVWTIFTWLWTVLVPFHNVAWRVALGTAFSGALASGLLAFVVSRGSSMIIESIDDLKNIGRRQENAICAVSGFVAGALIGFNGYMWSQSVIVEVYPLSVVSLMGVVLCLLRWVYAPHQHRYLYWAFFLYGICFNNHQSLLVIAMGMEVLVLVTQPKMGRELLFWNVLIYLGGLAIRPPSMTGNASVFVIFNIVGIASAVLWILLILKTRKTGIEFARDAVMLGALGCAALLVLGATNYIPFASGPGVLVLILIAGLVLGTGFVWLARKAGRLSREWLAVLGCGGSWLGGAAFYLYMPLAGMSNPPMQWGYPRTLNGFIHALTRGQYGSIQPTSGTGGNVFEIVWSFIGTYCMQLWRFLEGLRDEFNVLYLLLALVVFLFYRKMKRRERAWIIGVVAIFICLGPFLVFLLNLSSDRQSLELTRVFFTSAHLFVAMSVGYGLTLLAASLSAHYERLRKVAILGGVCAVDFAVFILAVNSQNGFNPDWASIYGFAKILCWLLAIGSLMFLWAKGRRDRPLFRGLPGMFMFGSLVPTLLAFSRDPFDAGSPFRFIQGIGDAFRPGHYGLPVYAALLLLLAALVFLCAVWLCRRKAPLAITLVLFALMPGYSILTHWSDNEQRNHWFGYWYGHDMFTPPFAGPDGKLTYDAGLREQARKGPQGDLVYPEMTRDAILFGGTDPGRFCPTYMIFCDSFIPDRCKPVFDQKFDRRDVYIITQNALADGTYLEYIRAHYFRSDQYQYDTPFFQELLRGPGERLANVTTNTIARLAFNILDEPLTRLGARIEARRRKEGVYPPKEIYIPKPSDSENCFKEYLADTQRRFLHDRQFPNEPKHIKPGEGVSQVAGEDGKMHIQVSGQVSVMSINGLLTKVIFDRNPEHEFFVEESFPLDWMFPHLTPFGIIMKINREPLPEITPEIVRRDHEFWSRYSERLIGNWITYDTPVSNIVSWIEKVYLRRDLSGFAGDPGFVRDDRAQKSFAKLRSSIAGIYSWRLGLAPGGGRILQPQYLVQTEAQRTLMLREADFAYKQAFAFCPYNPEAVFHYINLLALMGRVDDALQVIETCHKLDPENGQVSALLKRVKESMDVAPNLRAQMETDITQLEQDLRANPLSFQKALALSGKYMQLGKVDRAVQVLDGVLKHSLATPDVVFALAQTYAQMNNLPKVVLALKKYTKLAPDVPEGWYDLAAAQSALGDTAEALPNLRRALELSAKRLAQDPRARDLLAAAEKDPRLGPLRALPEYKAMIAPR